MSRRKSTVPIPFPERVRRIREAGLSTRRLRAPMREASRTLSDLEARVRLIEQFVSAWQDVKTSGMLFFVMYDIEDHKVRRHLAKYLIRQGCMRMQKSVFIGNTDHKRFRELSDTLEEVNKLYENGDSILILPVTRETITQLQVIGKDLNYKMAVAPPNVLII